MGKAYKASPPKDPNLSLSAAEAGALEKRLRIAAGAYYEVGQATPQGQKTWLENKPPGIIRRFKKRAWDTLLPDVKRKKHT